jgi:hypothetical protein
MPLRCAAPFARDVDQIDCTKKDKGQGRIGFLDFDFLFFVKGVSRIREAPGTPVPF